MLRTTTLYRPIGPTGLELIEKSGFHAFPPRLADQPIFHPVPAADVDELNRNIVGEIEVIESYP